MGHSGCLEAHNAARQPLESGAEAPQSGFVATPSGQVVDLEGEPKSLLNTRVQLSIGRQVMAGDIAYETTWKASIRGYHSVLTVNALGQQYEAEIPHDNDKKQAEKAAARCALEANKDLFAEAVAASQMKKD